MNNLLHKKSIVILDFGGQYAHLIANRIRRLGAFSEIHEPEISPDRLKDAAGIILSGGPQSVYDNEAPSTDPEILKLGIPVLGICFGHQWMAHHLGGSVTEGTTKEYGFTEIHATKEAGRLLEDMQQNFTVWMSHGDEVTKLPEGFSIAATSDTCPIAAMADDRRKFYGLQFHPEVTHTEHGMDILQRFIDTCLPAKWELEDVLEHLKREVAEIAGNRNVFILVSGGIDSTVAFTLLNSVLGTERVYGLMVDHGMMRKNEVHEIEDTFAANGFTNLHIEDASVHFLKKLAGITSPEEKRRIIGDAFIEVQAEVAKRLGLNGPMWMLGQGTIYPDTIETGRTKHAAKIKTHHNRVDAIEKMIAEGNVIEPLKELYKDEVRSLGRRLGLPHRMVWRHPFPGPGLGVRIICALSPDAPAPEETVSVQSSMYTFQILPVRSVGVQGDNRTYRHPVAIFLKKPFADLRSIHGLATSIPNSHPHINRVLLCTSHGSSSAPTPAVPNIVFTPTTIDEDTLDLLREADHLVLLAMQAAGLYEKIWQFPVVLLPIGTAEGNRSIVLRPVSSTEAMTANAYPLSESFLVDITRKLLELDGIDMVFYDVTNKPPGTIEWE